MNRTKTAALLFFFTALQQAFPCPVSEPNYYSLRSSVSLPPFLQVLPVDEAQFLPGGYPQGFYDGYFRPLEEEYRDAASAYQAALALEEAGKYAEASAVYRKIDDARTAVWEWGGSQKEFLQYPSPGPDRSASRAWHWLEAAYADEEDDTHFWAPQPTPEEPVASRKMPVPEDAAWIWSRPPEQSTAFQEAADRASLYTPEALASPRALAVYLAARSDFVAGRWEDCLEHLEGLRTKVRSIESSADELRFACSLHLDPDGDGLGTRPSARKLYNLALARIGQGAGPQTGAAKDLRLLLSRFPQSRYADDADYLLARLSIEARDFKGAGRYFRDLGLNHADDDLAPQGYLSALAAFAASRWTDPSGRTPTLAEAFWALSGGRGTYGPHSDLSALPGGLAAYLRFWRCQGLEANDPQRLSVLEDLAAKLPKDHFIRREAAFELVSSKEWARYLPVFFKDYPKDPRVAGLLEGSLWGWPDQAGSWDGFLPLFRSCLAFHPVPFLGGLSGKRFLPPSPFGKDGLLNEKYLLDTGQTGKLIEQDPASPWAFPLCLAYGREADWTPGPQNTFSYGEGPSQEKGTTAAQALQVVSAYADWYRKNGEDRVERLPILLARLAALRMVTGDWKGALDTAQESLRLGPKNWMADEALWVKAQCLEKLGEPQKALTAYGDLVDRYPNGAEAEDYTRNDFYGQMPTLERSPDASPYSAYAYAKLAAGMEKSGQWEKALGIYSKLGYRRDIAMVVDFDMPLQDLEQYVKDHPEDTRTPMFSRAVALRLFRKNDFDGALQWYVAPTPVPTPGQESVAMGPPPIQEMPIEINHHNDWLFGAGAERLAPTPTPSASARPTLGQARTFLGSVKAVQGYYQALETKDPEAKAVARYDLGRQFFYFGRTLYFNAELWHDIWFNDQDTVLAPRQPEDDSYHLPFLRYRDASYQFYRILQEDPGGPLEDRALYSYALCLWKSEYPGDAYVPSAPVSGSPVNAFYRVYQQCPQSPLADDALFWAGNSEPASLEADYSLILEQYPDGDLLKFFSPDQLLDAMKSGFVNPYGKSWADNGFWDHNAALRHNTDDPGAPAVLVDSACEASFEVGRPYSGWLYYRAPGGRHAYQALLRAAFDGVDAVGVTLDLDGRAVGLGPGKAKLFELRGGLWAPGTTHWAHFEAGAMPQAGMTLVHSMQFSSAGTTQATGPVTLALLQGVLPMTARQRTYSFPEMGAVRNAQGQQALDGRVLWTAYSDGAAFLLWTDAQGIPQAHFLDRRRTTGFYLGQWLSDGSVLRYSVQDSRSAEPRRVQLIGPDGVLRRVFSSAAGPQNGQLEYSGGALVFGHEVTIGEVPGAPSTMANPPRVQAQTKAGPDLGASEASVKDAAASGFQDAEADFSLPIPGGQWITWAGRDAQGRSYWVYRPAGWQDTGAQVFVVGRDGKISAKGSLPALGNGWKHSEAVFGVLPEGGIWQEFFDYEGPFTLVYRRLAISQTP